MGVQGLYRVEGCGFQVFRVRAWGESWATRVQGHGFGNFKIQLGAWSF